MGAWSNPVTIEVVEEVAPPTKPEVPSWIPVAVVIGLLALAWKGRGT